MMYEFLANNRDELISRCKDKVAQRPTRRATDAQLANGVPLFLDQLIRTLEAEEDDDTGASLRISGASGGDVHVQSELGVSASAHGQQLLALGYTVDQVVHDYGDLCQAITDLAVERDAPFAIREFRTLNRCLDNAIADAVTEFSFLRESSVQRKNSADMNERLGFLVHELRNAIGTATLAVSAMELGTLSVVGATGAVLKRSLTAATHLVDNALADVRAGVDASELPPTFSVASFIFDAKSSADLIATAKGCTLVVKAVDPLLNITGNRELLLSALANLLSNAFKFTHPRSQVTLSARAMGDRVLIDVSDRCGGLTSVDTERMFMPFSQRSSDKSGLGLGLSIARQSVEADAGQLTVSDVPGTGCVFTISLPRLTAP